MTLCKLNTINWIAQVQRSMIPKPELKDSSARQTERRDRAAAAREHGFVLLVVLWVLTSAVMLVASFDGAVRSGTASAVSEIGLTKSEALLDAGLEVAAARLIDQDKKRRWLGDGTTHTIAFAGAELTIAITDANALVDLNKSDGKLLRALFQKFTNSPIKAAQYTDIILRAREAASAQKKTDTGNTTISGATDASPSDLAFIDVSQLGRTPGIPREVFDQVAPFLTVYSEDGTIYPVIAADQVLEAIPIVSHAGIEKVRSADKSYLVGLMGDAPAFLTYEVGHAHLVTVRIHHADDDDYSVIRTYAIATTIDPDAPYRLLAKWPTTTIAAEK